MSGIHQVLETMYSMSADITREEYERLFPKRPNDYPAFKASPIIFYHYLDQGEAFKYRQMIIEGVTGVSNNG